MAIVVEMTSDEARLWAGMQKIIAQQNKMEAGFKKVGGCARKAGTKAARAGEAVKKAFDPTQLLRWGGLLTGGGAILGGLKLITRELRHQIKLQGRAKDTQLTLASAQASLSRNLGDVPKEENLRVLKIAGALTRKTGVEEKYITEALAIAVSASGGNVAASRGAVLMAAKILPDKPTQIPVYAGSLLDLAGVTGTIDPEVNAGLLAQVSAMSRVVKPLQQARSIPRALIGARAFGATTAGASAMFSALTKAGGDFSGEITATATVALAKQLQEFLPGEQTSTEMIKLFHAQPEMAEKFFETAAFEKTTLGPVRGLLLDPQSKAARAFAKDLTGIGDNEELARVGQRVAENVMGGRWR